MELPSREDFQRLEHELSTRLDRLIQLAEQGAFSPTIHTHGEVTEAEAAAVITAIRSGS